MKRGTAIEAGFYLLLILLLACAWIGTVGCAFRGKPRPYAICGVGSPARHNVEPMAGAELRWPSGASVEATYRPWFRVEEPSSRGFPRELGRAFVEARIPLGR